MDLPFWVGSIIIERINSQSPAFQKIVSFVVAVQKPGLYGCKMIKKSGGIVS